MSASVIHMVLEFCPTDLMKIILDQSVSIGTAQVKSFMQMIISGVLHMHENFVLHRGKSTQQVGILAFIY